MILVFGKTGQVARELSLFRDVLCLDRAAADLSDPKACADVIRAHNPSAVINAAAYTAVDQAENDEALATIVNGAAPAAMAKACAQLSIPFVHISTDYVFDGEGLTSFVPDDATRPIGAYGRSKLAGEEGVRAAGGAHVILRTSWVFSAHGNNFLTTMLRLGGERDALNIVADQIGGPTPACAIAAACLTIAEHLRKDPARTGTYHFSGTPDVSWADFARAIFDAAGLDCAVSDIPSTAYPTPAKRPKNSRLNCDSLSDFGLNRPDWRAAVKDIVTELER
jgi:dTDP-4-dehydrorhamnose reductase